MEFVYPTFDVLYLRFTLWNLSLENYYVIMPVGLDRDVVNAVT